VDEKLFERAREPVFLVDPDGDRIVAANAAACALLRCTREEVLSTPVSQIHPAEVPQLHEFLSRVLRDGTGSTLKLTCRTSRGDFLPVEMSFNAFSIGGRTYLVGLVQDRSEHRGGRPID
jgi:PAS domain S-box-containing protein